MRASTTRSYGSFGQLGTRRWIRRALPFALVAGLVAYLLLWPVPVHPVAWQPALAPALEGRYAENNALAAMTLHSTGNSRGPEDIAVDEQGRIYAGMEDGQILRFENAQAEPAEFANTGGRPLGLHFAADGRLIVADSYAGLVAVDADGGTEILATEVAGKPLVFTNDLDITAEGVVYFTDASSRFDQAHWVLDVLESDANGRLLKYDLNTGQASEILTGLFFANGVALAEDASFVLINETTRYRVTRHWLKGERAGETETLIDNLPGFPDGISRGSHGLFWLTLGSTRKTSVDTLAPYPQLRKVILRLPEALRPKPERHPFVLGIDAEGHVVHNLQEPNSTRFALTTSVQQHGDWLYIGSLRDPYFGRIAVPQAQ